MALLAGAGSVSRPAAAAAISSEVFILWSVGGLGVGDQPGVFFPEQLDVGRKFSWVGGSLGCGDAGNAGAVLAAASFWWG